MRNTLFDPDTVSNTFNNLAKGRHAYRILSAKASQKEGTDEIAINVVFKHLGTNETHTHHYPISAAGDRGRIARSHMKDLWDSTGLTGSPGLDRLPNFTDKVVEIEASQTDPKDDAEGRTFTNIRGTWPYKGPAVETPKFNQPEDPDDKIDTTPAPAPAAPAKTTAPAAAAAPSKKWKDRVKK